MALSKAEIFLNFATWTGAVSYSLYNFYLACNIFDRIEDTYNDFSSGWSFLPRKKDCADIEWQTILYLLIRIGLWCLIHALLSIFIISSDYFKQYSKDAQKRTHVFHALFTMVYIYVNLPLVLILMITLQPIVFLLFYALRNVVLMWFCWLMCLAFNTLLKFIDLSDYLAGYNEMDVFLTITCMFWMNLKCFSYFIDKFREGDLLSTKIAVGTYDKRDMNQTNYLQYFGYCFYLPTLFGGPFISFRDYLHCGLAKNEDTFQSFVKCERLLKNLLRVAFWVIFTEFALHFIYVNPMLYQIKHVRSFDSWTFYGYGYAMGQYFHLKYVILYGFSLSFAEFDGIPVPARPKCIGRIHVYSDMWKHFDRGFYVFLIKYLYVPLMNGKRTLLRQLFASTACFLFVYVWHGIATFILIWTIINLFTITAEKCFKLTLRSNEGQRLTHALNLSDRWRQRLHGVAAAPLLAISAMSNSYFFAGREVGDAFFAQFFASAASAKLTFFFLLYFCCQVSIEVKRWESDQRQRNSTRLRPFRC